MLGTPTQAQPPSLELDWEQGLFRAALRVWRWFRPAERALEQGRALDLGPRRVSLEAVARVVSGEGLEVSLGDGGAGLRGDALLLPAVMSDDLELAWNEEFALLRVCVLATMRRQGASLPPNASEGQRELASLRAVRAAVEALVGELDGFGGRWSEACARVLGSRPGLDALRGPARALEASRQDALRGVWPAEEADWRCMEGRGRGPASGEVPLWGLLYADEARDHAGQAEVPEDQRPSSGREAQAHDVRDVRRAALEQREDYNPILHTFEKIETLDEHRGGSRQMDGTDNLDEELEALREVKLDQVVRGGPRAEALLRADISTQAEIPDVARLDPSERGIAYDEWDWRAQRYKAGWCTVYPTPTRAQDPAWTRAALARQRRTIEALRDKLLIHRSRLQEAPRQRQGDDVDLDALVEALALRRAGHEDPRVYLQRQRRRRDVATTVLLDTSLSTDSWVQERRVLDVAREAALALGEVAHGLGDRLQILAFASHTRNICRIWEICGWSEPWTSARHKLGALKPQGYTRIGPALRHASSQLSKVSAQRRLLLLISDGKPTDYDRYEGRYGLADVRMALREARQAGVCVHALAVEATARASLPEAFGAGAWHILPRPEMLPQALTEAYGRLT